LTKNSGKVKTRKEQHNEVEFSDGKGNNRIEEEKIGRKRGRKRRRKRER